MLKLVIKRSIKSGFLSGRKIEIAATVETDRDLPALFKGWGDEHVMAYKSAFTEKPVALKRSELIRGTKIAASTLNEAIEYEERLALAFEQLKRMIELIEKPDSEAVLDAYPPAAVVVAPAVVPAQMIPVVPRAPVPQPTPMVAEVPEPAAPVAAPVPQVALKPAEPAAAPAPAATPDPVVPARPVTKAEPAPAIVSVLAPSPPAATPMIPVFRRQTAETRTDMPPLFPAAPAASGPMAVDPPIVVEPVEISKAAVGELAATRDMRLPKVTPTPPPLVFAPSAADRIKT